MDYRYLRRRYKKFVDSLPTYHGSGEIVRKIWWCWLQGEEQAPEMCKMCLDSLRHNLPNYEVIVVTEKNMCNLVDIPPHIMDKYQKGIISRTHFSDILRTLLLVKHGGVWIDSCVYCSGYGTPVFDYPLFVFQDWKFNMSQATVASSWFLSSEKDNPILRTVLDLLCEYWRRNNSLIDYFLYHLFFHIATEKYPALWKQVPRFSNLPPHILQFELFEKYDETRFGQITAMSDFHKLTWKDKRTNSDYKGTFYAHLIDQYKGNIADV